MSKRNKSTFDVCSSHLVAPPSWIEHPFDRKSSSSSPPNHNFITNKYRFTNKNYTFYEDNHDHIHQVDHITIDDGFIIIQNQKRDNNHFLHASKYPLHIDVDYIPNEQKCASITFGFDNQQSKDGYESSDGSDYAFDHGKLDSFDFDGSQITDTDGQNCMDDEDEKEQEEEEEGADEDNFTFATTSDADSMKFFQLMRSSSSPGPSKAGDISSGLQEGMMSPADELFEGGKIRPLIPSAAGCRHGRHNSIDRMSQQHLPSKSRTEAVKIDHGIFNGGVPISSSEHDAKHMVFKLMSSSAPASPAKEVLANEKENGITLTHLFQRCRSLTRAFSSEYNNEKTLQEQHYDGKGGGGGDIKRKRITLQDFLHQKPQSITFKPKQEQEQEIQDQKQEQSCPKASDQHDIKPLERPSSISPPQAWPIGEHLLLTTTTKKVRAPSPHVVHYKFHKAQADKMKKKTFLPYHPRLLGCLGYSPH